MEIKVKGAQAPVMSTDMRIHPEAYLLTEDEDKFIGEAYGLLAQTSLNFYSAINDKRLQDKELLKRIAQEEVFTLYEKKGIDIGRIQKICAKVEASKWWSLNLAQVLTLSDAEDGNKRIVFAFDLVSNDAGIKKRRLRTDKHAVLFDTPDVKKQARMLKIPDGVLYLPILQFHAINLLRNICGVYEGIDIEALDQHGFWLIPNNPVANAFYSIGSSALKNKGVKRDYDDNGMQITTCTITGTTGAVISIVDDGHTDLLFKSNDVDKMYTLLMKKALSSKSKIVTFTLDEFMEARGLKDRKEADKKAKAEIRALYRAEISYTYERGNKRQGTGRQRILQGIGNEIEDKRKGRKIAYSVMFNDMLYNEAIVGENAGVLSRMRGYELLPEEIQKIRNPHAYRFARVFYSQQRINVGSNTRNPCVLSVRNLLSKCSLPLYDDLKDKGQAGQRIIRPFIEAMESLVEDGIFTEYIFQHKKDGNNNLQLTDDELERLDKDYSLFSSLNVHVVLALQPDYSKLADKKKKRIEQAAAQSNNPKKKRGGPRKV